MFRHVWADRQLAVHRDCFQRENRQKLHYKKLGLFNIWVFMELSDRCISNGHNFNALHYISYISTEHIQKYHKFYSKSKNLSILTKYNLFWKKNIQQKKAWSHNHQHSFTYHEKKKCISNCKHKIFEIDESILVYTWTCLPPPWGACRGGANRWAYQVATPPSCTAPSSCKGHFKHLLFTNFNVFFSKKLNVCTFWLYQICVQCAYHKNI
jgi:hypothetical protein